MRGSYSIIKKDFVDVRILSDRDLKSYPKESDPDWLFPQFSLPKPPFLAYINTVIDPKLPGEAYFQKLQELGSSINEIVTPDSTLPLQMADLEGSDGSLTSWIKNNGDITPPRSLGKIRVTATDGSIFDVVSLEDLRKELFLVKAAVQLMRQIGTDETTAIKESLSFIGGNASVLVEGKEIHLEAVEKYGYEGNDVKKLAALVLRKLIEKGVHRYPAKRVLSPVMKDEEDAALAFEDVDTPYQAMTFIWGTLKDELVSGKYAKWHYKRCADCGTWEDLSLPGHRSTWTRCKSCVEKRRKEQSRERTKKARELAAAATQKKK